MTDKEILQGIDRLDAELPFDEICVGGKDNWHDIDVHELLSEIRERIKWHYPSKGEYPTEGEEVWVSWSSNGDYGVEKFYHNKNGEEVWGMKLSPPYAWQHIIPPKEEA